ncbi:MAG: hypothetical protein K8T90_07550 [Planctomycetes bacterium]|nr:hypothetical protein [Planctomycetota bacterium]
MPAADKPVRQSVSLPPRVARRVKSLAKSRRTSASRVLVDLIASGLAAADREKQHFLDVAERLAQSKDPAEQARLKDELARLTFGD